MNDFTHRTLRAVGKPVHRLGLSLSFGLDATAFSAALERGLNYVFWAGTRKAPLVTAFKEALARDRERYVIATGPTLAYFGGSVRRRCEAVLRQLGVEYIDVFQLYWLSRMSAWTQGTISALVKLKEEGKIRAIGVSIHDRPWAGELAEASVVDLFMLRYNAAHPGAERDVFPHLARRSPSVVAYTATSWRKLLKVPKGWDGPAMTAGDCYRFCLNSPSVDVVLTGPRTQKELEENVGALERGPLSAEEDERFRRFGKVVHG